jgi:hypothetical protein
MITEKNIENRKVGNNIKDLQREMLISILSSKGLIFRHYRTKFQQRKRQLNLAHSPMKF